MGNQLRAFITISAVLVATPGLLHAQNGDWGLEAGEAAPSGGAKQWVGSAKGLFIDLMESYQLHTGDVVRMRLGYFAFQGHSSAPQVLALSGGSAGTYPATASNHLTGLTYGADYIHPFPSKVYLLAGGGLSYLAASRLGTIDLSAAGQVPVPFRYSTNTFLPYACVGCGYQFNKYIALEGRYQYAYLTSQTRGVDLAQSGLGTAQATFTGFSAPTLTLGLVFNF